jgi:hypothetical protein
MQLLLLSDDEVGKTGSSQTSRQGVQPNRPNDRIQSAVKRLLAKSGGTGLEKGEDSSDPEVEVSRPIKVEVLTPPSVRRSRIHAVRSLIARSEGK